MKKKLLCGLLLMMASAFLFGCGSEKKENSGNDTTTAPTEAVSNGEFIMTSDKVKLIGRTAMVEDILWFSYSGTGVEFNFKGKQCEIILRGDSMVNQANSAPRYAVYVDGEIIEDKVMEAAIEKVMVVDAAETEEHVIKVLKLSEAPMSTLSIVSVNCDTDAEISPTPEKDLKIEFVGDSITCGYGVDGKLGDVFLTSNENCTKAYAYVTAQKLNADYSLVSMSGYGIISGYTDSEKKPEQALPQYYDNLGHCSGTFLRSYTADAIEWDFSFKPDVVVVNLGTNDASYTKNDPEKIEDYISHYVEFLKHIKEKNPDAKILTTLGIMGQDLCPAVEETVARYKQETGDEDIYFLKLDLQGSEVVVDWHPTSASHEHAADQVSEYIKEILGI